MRVLMNVSSCGWACLWLALVAGFGCNDQRSNRPLNRGIMTPDETTPPPAAIAAPRTDANSQLAHRQLIEKARKGRIDIYFVGDSITRRWGTSDEAYKPMLANWNENFYGWNAGNFGWGGD